MANSVYQRDRVYGIVRDLPLNYIERPDVDDKLLDVLKRDKHIVIYGSSKQGKTCLRKHCINEGEKIEVQCNNRWDLSDIHASILKQAGYSITVSEKTAISGSQKIKASLKSGIASLGSETTVSGTKEKEERELELDPENVNDIITALESIDFNKYIILEDFHYLPSDVQEDFAVSLKAFHEASDLCFIVVGVWLDENRLIVHNGDLAGRVIAVNADEWKEEQLLNVIEEGEDLLNIEFQTSFKKGLVSSCFDSVYIVQEACREACKRAGVEETQPERTSVDCEADAQQLINFVVDNQSAQYEAFLRGFADGFKDTELEMYKWLLYPILTSDIEELENGIHYSDLRGKIQGQHPEGTDLNPGNLTQALQYTSSLQVDINVKPIILDYDQTNSRLSVVDRGFLIWLASQDEDYLLEKAGLLSEIN